MDELDWMDPYDDQEVINNLDVDENVHFDCSPHDDF